MEWCNGCDLYVYKIHLCPVVGVWINIDSYHLHFIIGSREEDVRRTSTQEGDEYKVYFFNKRQDLHEKLDTMGRHETFYRRKEILEPEGYKKLSEGDCKAAIEKREQWKQYNKNYYFYNQNYY